MGNAASLQSLPPRVVGIPVPPRTSSTRVAPEPYDPSDDSAPPRQPPAQPAPWATQRALARPSDLDLDPATPQQPSPPPPAAPPGPTPEDSGQFPADGVALWALAELASRHALELAGRTTAEAAAAVVRPLTASSRCSYAEMLRRSGSGVGNRSGGGDGGSGAVGPATVYVCHAWSGSVFDLLETLQARAVAPT